MASVSCKFSKALTDASVSGAHSDNPVDRRYSYGVADFDRRNVVAVTYITTRHSSELEAGLLAPRWVACENSSDIVHRMGPNGLDKASRTSRTGLPFQKRLQLSSEVNVRLSIRSMYSVPRR